jgi:biopolymer transport protein ExbB
MFDLMRLGGPIMWLLAAAGVAAVVLFLERGFHVHRARIKTHDFLKGIANIIRRRNYAEAVTICEETPGPVACITRAAIVHRAQAREGIQRAMDQAALTEIARLERRLAMLATLGQVAPLLGLLGGVLGLIEAFLAVQEKGPLVHSGDLASGMWQALITAAAGLAVALFCHLGYNLLVSKVDAIVLDMEWAAGEILALFTGSSVAEDE